MSEQPSGNGQPSIFRKLFDRVFPKMGDFFGALSSPCQHVAQTAGFLVEGRLYARRRRGYRGADDGAGAG